MASRACAGGLLRVPSLAVVVGLLVLCLTRLAHAQGEGTINGRLVRPDGSPLSGATAVLESNGAVEFTSADGRYRFTHVPAGRQTVRLTLGTYVVVETILVQPDVAADVRVTTVEWPLSRVEMITVEAASKQVERIAEAPAAVTAFDAAELARQSGQAQLPLLLASAPGVQVAQAGLYDYSLNARGFNEMVNRRVRVEIDGRDASQAHVMGNADWASLGQAIGEFDQVEMVRGPAGALYGLGAVNGVLSLHTKAPADSLGGRARVTFGELGMARVDARHAAALGRGWFAKVVGGYQRSGGFAESRVDGVEYAPGQLAREAVPLASDVSHIAYGSIRVDKQFDRGDTLVMEAGTSSKDGPLTITNLGRYQATDATYPWVRVDFRRTRWRMLGALTGADIKNQLSLASGTHSFQDGQNLQLEGQGNGAFAGGRGRLVGGVSFGRQYVDSADESGQQTIFDQPESSNSGALFGQADYDVTKRLTASLALRVDATSLTRTTISPRAAAVYQIHPGQFARVAYGDAFKPPTLAEARLRSPIAPPLNLSAIESALAPVLNGVALGFENLPLLAVGNEHLEVEEIRTLEFGYTGLIHQTLVQAAYYRNRNNPFTTGLLPQVGTSLGRLNPTFGPYHPPAGVSPEGAAAIDAALAAAVPTLAPFLSQQADGRPVFAVLSLASSGEARTQGLELSSITMLPSGWRMDVSYAWFDLREQQQVAEALLHPNTPRHQAAAGVTYVSTRFDAGARARWVDAFDWVSGVYAGSVPSYAVVDLTANVPLSPRLTVGLDVSNLLNHEHYEIFGGDLLRRRAVAHLDVAW